jgi:plasmid stabilization system protein ParE
MAHRIIFTPAADVNLGKIRDYLVKNDYNTNILVDIRREIYEKLSEKPLSHMLYNEKRGIRKVRILKKNLVLYLIKDNDVMVLEIRAGGMNSRF